MEVGDRPPEHVVGVVLDTPMLPFSSETPPSFRSSESISTDWTVDSCPCSSSNGAVSTFS